MTSPSPPPLPSPLPEPTPRLPPLSETLREWTDYDIAMYGFGRVVGVIPEGVTFGRPRGMFFMETPLSTALGNALDALVPLGVLEYRPVEYRWAWPSDTPAFLRLANGDDA